ncbi:MAG: helix-turn-helix domain-containing protein [bacterium]
MSETRKLNSLLTGLGFSGLEASVYLALLREPGATGYRVAQLTGKPAPNTYKALDALRAKGAVLLDDSAGSRSYTALPVGEYLDGLKRGLDSRKQEIEQALAAVAAPAAQGGLYKLTSFEQVYERARGLLRSCRDVALVDAFPGPLEKLRPDIERAAKRGVSVFVKAYRPVELAGCDMAQPREGENAILAVWNGDWLNVIADCTECVLAFLKPGGAGVNEAVWVRNAYLGMLVYNGMFNEFMLTRVLQALKPKYDLAAEAPELRELGRRYSNKMLAEGVVPASWKREWKATEKKTTRSSRAKTDRR